MKTLAEVVVGDSVVIRGADDSLTNVKVVATWKTKFAVTGERQFYRATGRLVGATPYSRVKVYALGELKGAVARAGRSEMTTQNESMVSCTGARRGALGETTYMVEVCTVDGDGDDVTIYREYYTVASAIADATETAGRLQCEWTLVD